MLMPDKAGLILAIWLIASLGVVAVWDAYVYFMGLPTTCYVSHYLQVWGRTFPAGVLIVGVVIGHLLWPDGKD